MTGAIDKVLKTDLTGGKRRAAMSEQKANLEASRKDMEAEKLTQSKADEALKVTEAQRAAASRRVRSGKSGKRSLMTKSFKGIQPDKTAKSKTLG